MNNITIHGRLTRDPELKDYTAANGDVGKMCRFCVAVDRRFGDETDFFECVTFGKPAEVIDKFFSKGKEIVVSGSMECNSYKAKDGTKRYPWRLRMSSFDFCGSKKDGEKTESDAPSGFGPVNEEDIPF